ncbi:MAG TPA: ATP-binding protein [Methylomirabilota bacterium]|nr:ATP-binding protein [Methylomirabilota bacterium]
MRLRSHLIALVLAVLVPMIAFSAIAVVTFGGYQRAAAQRSAEELARALMNAVDESLRSTITTLEVVATRPSLDAGNLESFHSEARRVLASHPAWINIILLAPDGRPLVNAIHPPGGPLPPPAESASIATVVATRRPAIGGLAPGPITGEHAVPIRVPVLRDGRLVYVLTAVVKPASLVEVLERQRIPADWVGTIFDTKKQIVARTLNLEQFLGRPISAEFAALVDRDAPEHWAVTHTLEGAPVYTSWFRSPMSGWGVGLGIPPESVEGPLRRSLLAIAAGALASTVLAVALAVVVGRRITTPIVALSSSAKSFAERGTLAPEGRAAVEEVEDVRRAFAEAAALVQQRAAEAEAANRAKDEFLAVLSHELRTPLNAVYGWARLLQAGQVEEGQVARALEVIVRQSNAQVQLIDDLLDVSRVISGKMRLDVRPVELAPVVEQALDAVRPAAAAREIALQAVLDPGAGPVAGDPDRLQQVVWNLVMNAVKFTPKGGRVQVRLQRAESQVEIVVSDTGKGIAPEVLPFVFDRFRQADSSSTREHSGLGVGLALVKHLVDLHGGSVTAHSEGEGRGATFVVSLPLAMADVAGAPARAQPTARPVEALAAAVRLDGVRVLLVDDDPEALDLAVAILAAAGARLRMCTSADEGLAALREWRPDVLVSDIEMPGQDGYELIRRVRELADAEGGRTPAIALTAYGRAQDRMRSLGAGYTMHVPKPVDPAELATIIASVAGRPAAP